MSSLSSLFGRKPNVQTDFKDDPIDKKEEYQIVISRDGKLVVTFDTGKYYWNVIFYIL